MANRPTYVWTGSEWDTIADPGAVRNTGGSTITASTSTTVALSLKGAASQTGNLLQTQNSSGTILSRIDPNGRFRTNTADDPVLLGVGGSTIGVRIGTNSATAKLEGVDSSSFTSSYQPLEVGGSQVSVSISGTERMRIDSTGRVRILSGGVLEAPVVTNAQTTSYTLVLADAGKLIEINNAGATTLTIPADASVAFPVGTKIDVLQTGAGQVTIAGSGFTPNATPGLKISAQWGAATLVKRGTNSWVVIGNLSA